MPSRTPRLLVFDLDGTLIDSRIDLCNSVNATLAHLNRPLLPNDVIAGYVGDGVTTLVSRALSHHGGRSLEQAQLQQAVDFFLEYYRSHKLDFTYVYPGVHEALGQIQSSLPGILMAVLTNKPVHPSREICQHLQLAPFFFQNYGGNSFPTKKPDPAGLRTLMKEATSLLRRADADAPEVSSAETVMIGDSDVDVLTARNGQTRSIGCTFGLSPESLLNVTPNSLAHSPSDWPELLAQL